MQIFLSTNKALIVYLVFFSSTSLFCQDLSLQAVKESSVRINQRNYHKINGIYASRLWSELIIDTLHNIDSTYLTALEVNKDLSLKISLLNQDSVVVKTKTLQGELDEGYLVLPTRREFTFEYFVIWSCYSQTVRIRLNKSGDLLVNPQSSNIVFLILFPVNGVGERERVEKFSKK